MKLDRIHNIACICSAVFCLPALLVVWLMVSLLASDTPDWGWYAMTMLITVPFVTMTATFFMRKSRDWDLEHGRIPHRKNRR